MRWTVEIAEEFVPEYDALQADERFDRHLAWLVDLGES